MSRANWIAEGNDENEITDQMEVKFLKLDSADAAANAIKVNDTLEELKQMIQGIAFKVDSGGAFSASTVPLSSNTTPMSAGVSPNAGGGFSGAFLNPFSFGAGAGAGAISFGATPGAASPAIDVPVRPFFEELKGDVISQFKQLTHHGKIMKMIGPSLN